MAFGRCSRMERATLLREDDDGGGGGCLVEIADYAFRGCASLAAVRVPGSVRSIGYEVFRDCTGLESVEIDEGLERVGFNAFWDCRALMFVRLPRSILAIVGARLGEGQVAVPSAIPTFVFGS
jgi:hypothetical protein